MQRPIASVLATALVLTACSGGTPDEAITSPTASAEAPTPSASPSAAPTVAEIDITTTPPPDQITVEWADAVINELLATYGRLGAAVLAEPVQPAPVLPEGTAETLLSIFRGEYLERRRVELQTYAVDLDEVRSRLLPAGAFTGLRVTTTRILFAEADCVIAVGRLTQEGTLPSGAPFGSLSALSLARKPPTAATTNPTQWVIIDALLNTDPDGVANEDAVMLDASFEDFAGSLDHECESTQ